MKPKSLLAVTLVSALALLLHITLAAAQQPASSGAGSPNASTAFTYQGRLHDGTQPANGSYDFTFELFADAEGGQSIAPSVVVEDLAVKDGAFTTLLDFGGAAFNGTNPHLAISVRLGDSDSAFTPLTPRQVLTPAPHALYAAQAETAHHVQWADISGVPAALSELGARDCEQGDTMIWGDPGWKCGPFVASSVARPGFTRSAIDTEGTVGEDSSIIMGSDGLGLISYYSPVLTDLKIAHCSDVACSRATVTAVAPAGQGGPYTSITVGSDGLGLASFYGLSQGDLKVAHCENLACTDASVSTLDSAADVGGGTSIVIGADGLALISYHDQSNSDLKVAHCNDIECSSASTATLDSVGDVGFYTSVTIGADGLGLISYWDRSNGNLKVAHCANLLCSSAQITTIDASYNDVGRYSSITIGSDGLGLISHFDETADDLRVAHCTDLACSAATHSVLDTAGSLGQKTTITQGQDGLGLISYFDNNTADVKVAHCSNVLCSSASTTTIESEGIIGSDSSITIGSDGLALASYFDGTNGDLKVAHCANPLCTPFVRRR